MPVSIDEIAARTEIADLAARWTDAVNWRDYDRFGALWTADAAWTIGEPQPMTVRGVDAIVAKLRELLTIETAFFQALHAGVIEVAGDAATARWGLTEMGRPQERGSGYYNRAVYVDDMVRTAGGWRFARRDYRYVYLDPTALPGVWYALADATRIGG